MKKLFLAVLAFFCICSAYCADNANDNYVLNRINDKLTSGVPSSGTVAVSAASLPLPSGASTSAKQDTANASLATIASNTASTSNLFVNITTSTTTAVKSGAGTLHTITVNNLGTVASLTVVYDNTAGSGTKIASINTLAGQESYVYDVAFSTGLTVVTTGTVAPDITVSYR